MWLLCNDIYFCQFAAYLLQSETYSCNMLNFSQTTQKTLQTTCVMATPFVCSTYNGWDWWIWSEAGNTTWSKISCGSICACPCCAFLQGELCSRLCQEEDLVAADLLTGPFLGGFNYRARFSCRWGTDGGRWTEHFIWSCQNNGFWMRL